MNINPERTVYFQPLGWIRTWALTIKGHWWQPADRCLACLSVRI
jgi:hypothetical protein